MTVFELTETDILLVFLAGMVTGYILWHSIFISICIYTIICWQSLS